MEAGNFYVPYEGWTPKYVASRTLGSINIPIEHVGSATVFLSLFHLARAVALLPSDERPIGLSAGQKWARAVFIWVCLASVTSMCLFFSVWAGEVANNDYGTFTDDVSSFYRSIVSTSLRIALYATHIICAICVLVYIAKTRKKLGLSTTSHKVCIFPR
ncbi:hypothetical protein LZ32DRAFT_608962 [Colletotrichum eremochloae]|nr:hypothetical protein LZ32DRAFT_608962 [Colletotrichum eremochloae]